MFCQYAIIIQDPPDGNTCVCVPSTPPRCRQCWLRLPKVMFFVPAYCLCMDGKSVVTKSVTCSG